ncbi:MAG: energy transducer TonB, partial [Lachnospira sp.]|nr:energy transducer TonB [Lachnospira sp.]
MARTLPSCISIMESSLNSSAEASYAVQGRDSISENQGHIYINPEIAPVWKKGGTAGMYKFINENLCYPEELRKKKIEGKVFVRFVVEKDGSITNAKVVRSLHPLADKEALRVIRMMPPWTPGSLDGKSAKSYFVIPINFIIEDSKSNTLNASQRKKRVARKQKSLYDDPENRPSWKEGGSKGLYNFVKKNLYCSGEFVKEKTLKELTVSFMVQKDGSLADVRVVHSLNPLLDKEALRVISMMPLWTPALYNGKPVDCRFVLPISFSPDSLDVQSSIDSLAPDAPCPLIVVNGVIKNYPVEYQRKLVENGFTKKEAVANWFKVEVSDVKKITIVKPKKAAKLFSTKRTKYGAVKYTIENLPYILPDESATLFHPTPDREDPKFQAVFIKFIVEKDGSISNISVPC